VGTAGGNAHRRRAFGLQTLAAERSNSDVLRGDGCLDWREVHVELLADG
jgi:hypothetical protein